MGEEGVAEAYADIVVRELSMVEIRIFCRLDELEIKFQAANQHRKSESSGNNKMGYL